MRRLQGSDGRLHFFLFLVGFTLLVVLAAAAAVIVLDPVTWNGVMTAAPR